MSKKDFDDSKVFTPASKDASKYYGAKVLYADTYQELKRSFNRYYDDMVQPINKDSLTGILKGWSTSSMSFMIEGLSGKVFDFIYVLEGPPMIQERPFKDTEEFLEVYTGRWIEHMNRNYIDPMSHPTIWIREIDTKKDFMVVGMDENTITIIDSKKECVGEMIFGGSNSTRTVLTPVKLDMTQLAARFSFLDGSDCIVRVKL